MNPAIGLNFSSGFKDPLVYSDEWWVDQLSARLQKRITGEGWSSGKLSNQRGTSPGIEVLNAWYRGEPPPPEGCHEEWVANWQSFLRRSRMNMAETIVSSVSDRVVPTGWSTAADNDSDGDMVAARVAAESNLVVCAGDSIDDMLWSSRGYLLVGGFRESGAIGAPPRPTITSESPFSTIVAHSRQTGLPLAGLRLMEDPWTGETEIWFYRPGSVRTARRARYSDPYVWSDPFAIPGGDFPLIELMNRRGVGEYERHLDSLARLNDSLFNRIVLTKLQAHRQRALEKDVKFLENGDDVEVDVENLHTGPDELWDLPPGVKLWESGATDLSHVRLMVQDDIKMVCSETGTPLSDAVPDAANQSAKGSEVIENKYLFRIEDRMRRIDQALARAMSLCFKVLGDDQRSDVTGIRTHWGPIERYGLQEKAQAATTLNGLMPRDWVATSILGIRPDDLPDINRQRMSDLLQQAVVTSTATAAAPAPAPAAAPTEVAANGTTPAA